MNGKSHELVTKKAFDILQNMYGAVSFIGSKNVVAAEAVDTDHKNDLEFVDVDKGTDDPHTDSFWDDDDEAHYKEDGRNLTAFNHFIDIKKGIGIFDDYDGYSYKKGSASNGEYQKATEVTSGFAYIGAWIMGKEVDEGINWWFDDEYVHAPCHPWYKNCSPSIVRYSFPKDKGAYNSVVDELKVRFPMGKNGVPFSVFMPVDNMARFWYYRFKMDRVPKYLGPVMHAIQDASVPHHASGYMGNWHGKYETVLETKIKNNWLTVSFENGVKTLVKQWDRKDKAPPNHLNVNDWNKIPAKNWRIDHLVTWIALNAHKEYKNTYKNFKNGYLFDNNSAKNLAKIATAMSVLVLIKASDTSISLIEALANIGKHPPFSVPSGFKQHPKTENLKKIMEFMYKGRLPK